MQCIGCGKTFVVMFVCWILGKDHRCCASYPSCCSQRVPTLAERMNTVDKLVSAPVLRAINPVAL
jgi:hypothetical protein